MADRKRERGARHLQADLVDSGASRELETGLRFAMMPGTALTPPADRVPRSSDGATYSVVVPVYNGEQTVDQLIERLSMVLPGLGGSYEVILVNDGSADRSWDVICRLSERHPWVHGITLLRNYGQHNALLCGIRAANHDVIVTMDDDLQHPPEEIPKLIAVLNQGYDVVYGTPAHQQHGVWRDIASTVTKLALQSVMGSATARQVSAFRTFREHLREAFAAYQGSFVSIDVLLTWGTTHFAAVAVRHDLRAAGVSNYTFRKLLTHALNMMTGYTTLPLRLASLVGFAFTFFGMTVFAYVFGRYVALGGSVPGFPFLASIIAVFSGAQLFALGIIGEYLARMHFRMMERPAYGVRSTTGARADPQASHVLRPEVVGTSGGAMR
jgi:glycosyltransferase involved in cell wall biosynthesis